jgi:hypothetical protein
MTVWALIAASTLVTTLPAAQPDLSEHDPMKLNTSNQQYSPEQITAQDLSVLLRKAIDRYQHTADAPELREFEHPPPGGDWNYPHRGREDDFINFEACRQANKLFSSLARHIGNSPANIDPDLIAATIRNEQYHYHNLKDTGPDHYIRARGQWPFQQDESIGPAQMQVRNIKEMARHFPEQLGPENDAVKLAETVDKAPYFVGAYFAQVICGIETKQKPACISDTVWKQVNDRWHNGERNQALIIAYNPSQEQVRHVLFQLNKIKSSKTGRSVISSYSTSAPSRPHRQPSGQAHHH